MQCNDRNERWLAAGCSLVPRITAGSRFGSDHSPSAPPDRPVNPSHAQQRLSGCFRSCRLPRLFAVSPRRVRGAALNPGCPTCADIARHAAARCRWHRRARATTTASTTVRPPAPAPTQCVSHHPYPSRQTDRQPLRAPPTVRTLHARACPALLQGKRSAAH